MKLEAIDIFFNDKNAIVKIDSSDVNKSALQENDKETIISAIFSDLPEKIIIDTTNETSFDEEYLLNADGKLEIVKKYSNGGSAKIFIRAFHPTNSNCSDLLLKKNKDYKDIIVKNNITCDNLVVNAIMRKSIWGHFSEDLRQQEILIDTSKEDAKNIWEKIQPYLPIYTLFQSDRKNSDGDSEVQDPLKLAVQQVFSEQELRQEMERIYEKVVERLKSVSEHTLEKLNEMNPDVAFEELTEEYHNELYGYIEAEKLKKDYKKDKIKIPYKRISGNKLEDEEVTLTEYIRHQIHHPENKHNDRFTYEQLIESVNMMRDFIIEKRAELS